MFDFVHPAVLLLLPVAFIPLLRPGQAALPYPSLALLPDDAFSTFVDAAIRGIMMICLGAIVFGLAGFHRAEETVERIGRGAEMVILLDSSGSMDRPFASHKNNRSRVPVWGTYSSKGQVARRMLAQYVEQRPQDLFAMFAFSRNPIEVLPLTNKQDVVQAAIEAGTYERGLGTTDLAAGLIRAFSFFRDRPFAGSRIVMLVSDGAAVLTLQMQEQITYLMERYRVSLYWIYLRAHNSPGLATEMDLSVARDIAPEQLVHKFFLDSGLPYRAFSAEDPEALLNAIREVNKLQNLPLQYTDVVPRRDLSWLCYGIALVLLTLLIVVKLAEIRVWR